MQHQGAIAQMTASSLQHTTSAAAVNNIGITYKTSLMRTNAGHGREDNNIEDIHCQIVMRRQRNNQILRELEGGNDHNDMLATSQNIYDESGAVDTFMSRHNSAKPGSNSLHATGEHHSSCIQVKEVEILGPDYCSKRPVFLPQHFPDMIVTGGQNAQLGPQQAKVEPPHVVSTQASGKLMGNAPQTAP